MQRRLSTLLIVGVLLPLLATLLALGQETQLPMCCRRAGAHHCMQMAAVDSGNPMVRSVCPAFPRLQSSLQAGMWTLSATPQVLANLVHQPAILGQIEAGYRIASLRSRQKRGPPFLQG